MTRKPAPTVSPAASPAEMCAVELARQGGAVRIGSAALRAQRGAAMRGAVTPSSPHPGTPAHPHAPAPPHFAARGPERPDARRGGLRGSDTAAQPDTDSRTPPLSVQAIRLSEANSAGGREAALLPVQSQRPRRAWRTGKGPQPKGREAASKEGVAAGALAERQHRLPLMVAATTVPPP